MRGMKLAIEIKDNEDNPMDPLVDGIPVSDYFQAVPEKKILNEQQLMRIGASIPEGKVHNSEILNTVRLQRENYQKYSKETLITELCRRDENEIRKGQEVADGRMQTRFLREVLRTILYTQDHGTLRNALGDRTGKELDNNSKAGTVENLLRALGAEHADNRQLRLDGSTLGSLDARPPEEAIEDPLVPTQGQARVADDIREFRDEKIARQVNETRRDEDLKPFSSPSYPEKPEAD